MVTRTHRRPNPSAGRTALVGCILGLAVLFTACTGATGSAPASSTAGSTAESPAATPPTASEAPAPQGSASPLQDLGQRVCADSPDNCGAAWSAGMARGEHFNVLIAESCLQVYLRIGEDAGIACLERSLRLAPALPAGLLVEGQFAPGERAHHPLWHDRSDREWARSVARYFEQIPAYCDQATPVIYHYFPCLLREVRFFQQTLKETQRLF